MHLVQHKHLMNILYKKLHFCLQHPLNTKNTITIIIKTINIATKAIIIPIFLVGLVGGCVGTVALVGA